MKSKNIDCFFHYYPLHLSSFGKKISKTKLKNTEKIYNGLVRLPLYPTLKKNEYQHVTDLTINFIKKLQNE